MNSQKIMDFVSELTYIHNAIVDDRMFSAGVMLTMLQQRLLDEARLKEAEEKSCQICQEE